MKLKWNINEKIKLIFGMIVVCLLFIGAFAYLNIQRLQSDTEWVEHSYRIIQSFQKIHSDLKDAQTLFADYLLTQGKRPLQPCKKVVKTLDEDLKSSVALTLGENLQQKNMEIFQALARKKISTFQRELAFCDEGRFDLALSESQSEVEKINTKEIKELAGRMSNMEASFLKTRMSVETSGTRKNILFMGFSTLLSLLICGGAAYFVNRQIRERQVIINFLRSSEERFRFIAENANDAFITVDSAGKIVDVNPSTESMYGYTKKELFGQSLTALMPKKFIQDYGEKAFSQFIEMTDASKGIDTVELFGRRKNQEEFPIELSVSTWETKNGVFHTAILRDITDRKFFMKMLLKNEHRLFQFLEAVPIGIFVLDATGSPYYVSQSAKDLLATPIDWNGSIREFSETYHFYRADSNLPYPHEQVPITRALGGETSYVEDIEIHLADRNTPIEMWGTPIHDEHQTLKYSMAAFADVTDRKQLEKMKNDLISIVSHQLKTPVAEINGYIENMLEGLTGDLTPKQKQYLLEMREISMANFRMISDLLSMSKIERGVMTVDLRPVPLSEILDLAIRDYENAIQKKGLRLMMEINKQETLVLADKDKTVETLRNIINNAVKFTDQGTISISVKNDNFFSLIEISDTGIGMGDKILKKLFTKERALGVESFRSGAGLGLYIAKNFMKLQNGDVTVTSQPGKGSNFFVKIPNTKGELP